MLPCSRCDRAQPPSSYRAQRRVCRECEREYDRSRYARSVKRREMIAAWKRAHPQEQAAYDKRRRALKLDASVATFTAQQLEQRMSMYAHCYICHELLDDVVHYDHVKPLKHGGAHTLSNLRATHALCNLVKSSKWSGIDCLDELLQGVQARVNELLNMEDT